MPEDDKETISLLRFVNVLIDLDVWVNVNILARRHLVKTYRGPDASDEGM